MSEIEKMYENAKVKEVLHCNGKMSKCTMICKGCQHLLNGLPLFTAEKQILLIQWLAKKNLVIYKNLGGWFAGIVPTYIEELGIVCKNRAKNLNSFTEVLAKLINSLWNDLTPEEKQQVKGILE